MSFDQQKLRLAHQRLTQSEAEVSRLRSELIQLVCEHIERNIAAVDIARTLSIPESTVRSWYKRWLEAQGHPPSPGDQWERSQAKKQRTQQTRNTPPPAPPPTPAPLFPRA